MSDSLLIKGGVNRGKLEKFADVCNAMARSFWQGHKVELLKEGKNYTLQASGNGKTLTSSWMDLAASTLKIYPLGVVIAPTVVLAYVLACIPVAITMGIGLAAKKIVLATDENAYRYHKITQEYHVLAQKYLTFSKQDKELKQTTEILNLKRNDFQSYQKQLQSLEGTESPIKDKLDKKVKENRELIEDLENKIEKLNKSIENLTNDCDDLKNELTNSLETYFSNKNEQFENIHFLISANE